MWAYPRVVPLALALLVLALATARATRIVTEDIITAPIRKFFIRRLGEEHWFTYLIHCPYCASLWIGLGAGLVATLLLAVAWWWVVPLALVFSQVAIWTAKLDGD